MNQPPPEAAPSTRHTVFEDVQGLLIGTLFVAVGVRLFAHAGLLTGGTAGIAFLVHYASGLGFGAVFFVINLPFYWLAWTRLGPPFAVKTFAAVALLSGFSTLLPRWMAFSHLEPLFAALAGGVMLGAGLLSLFRHQASLGGSSIVVAYLQKRFGWRAGVVQMGIDAVILLIALLIVEPGRIGLSVLGALAMNATLAINHRTDRYVAL